MVLAKNKEYDIDRNVAVMIHTNAHEKAVYDVTVGPVWHCMATEIPSTRLRIKTVAMARSCYNILSIMANFLNNLILNPTAWNQRGKDGFIWVPSALVSSSRPIVGCRSRRASVAET